MKKLIALILTLCLLLTCSALADTATARLTQRVPAYAGPGTGFFSTDSYLKRGDYVTVHTKTWDYPNDMWWLQVEYTVDGYAYRAYISDQYVSADLSKVPEEEALGIVCVTSDADVFAGPGWEYTMWNDTLYRGTSAVLLEVEAGYALIECWNERWQQAWRVWAPLSKLDCWDEYTSADDTYPSDKAGSYNSTVEVYPIGQTCRIGASSANARSGAGTEYAIVEYVFWGERFTILDTRTASNGKMWYQIRKDGVYCWISSGICTLE